QVGRLVDLREVEVVREARQRGDTVHRRVEDQLRPLRGTQVWEGLGLQPARLDQLRDTARVVLGRAAVGPDPGGGVEDVLDVRIAAACSSRRVSTFTSATCARWAARSEPIEPAPATTTRVTVPSLTRLGLGQFGLTDGYDVESRDGPAEALERELADGDSFDE